MAVIMRTVVLLTGVLAVSIGLAGAQGPASAPATAPSSGSSSALTPEEQAYLPYADPRLAFSANKTSFKILQVADMHYGNGTSRCLNLLPAWAAAGSCSDVNTTDFLGVLLDREKPDLVVFTGDNIMAPDVNDHAVSQRAWRKPVEARNIPFMTIFGNHDDEVAKATNATVTRETLMTVDMESPMSLSKPGPKGLFGTGTYAYAINDASGKPKFVLYLLDSGSYDVTGRLTGSYGWIHANQITWYNQTSRAVEKQNGGQNVTAVGFYHIPIPEYENAFTCACTAVSNGQPSRTSFADFGNGTTLAGTGLKTQTGCANQTCNGVKQEGVYSASVNSGLLAAIVERGDIKMMNVGHDHVNDYCASFQGVHFCYAGGFGYHAYNTEGFPRRARVITLSANGTISTYKALDAFATPPYATQDFQQIYPSPSV